tara:strand:- start:159 stop:332 length:174 start_codon:yes stop_codon:yes gene_type:complete
MITGFEEWIHKKMDDGHGGFIENGDILTEDYDYNVVKAIYNAGYEDGYQDAHESFTK